MHEVGSKIIRFGSIGILDDACSIDALNSPWVMQDTLRQYAPSRPHIVLTGFTSQYLYTRFGSSPTIYGYAQP